uniref:Syntaxin N-terminal domain-containing protein n=1 Tax=Salix viminalis TaxID=40686 RepID=A0A6N2NHT0_SALVM
MRKQSHVLLDSESFSHRNCFSSSDIESRAGSFYFYLNLLMRFCKILAKMNDLMTRSFLSYVELKKQAQKDVKAELDIESGQLNPTDEPNLSEFFHEVNGIKTEMEDISNLLSDLQTLNEESKSTRTVPKFFVAWNRICEGKPGIIDRSNISNRRVSELYKEGSSVDRTRLSVHQLLES